IKREMKKRLMERGKQMSTIARQKGTKGIIKVLRALAVIIGAFITAYGLESVLIPNNVSDGGVTGLSIVGSQIFGLPLGILIAILNIPFIFLGYKQIGKSFAIYSVIGIASLAFSTSIMHHIPTIVQGDTLLITVVGGIIIGLGTGLSIVGSQIFGLPLGILIAILNIPFIFLGYKQIGKSFAIYSVIGIASLAFSTSIMHHIPTIVQGDTLLITVVGGIIIGLGMGL